MCYLFDRDRISPVIQYTKIKTGWVVRFLSIVLYYDVPVIQYTKISGNMPNTILEHDNLQRCKSTNNENQNKNFILLLKVHEMFSLVERLKLRLHYNESVQRTPTVWRYFAFVDIRWYTFVSSSV